MAKDCIQSDSKRSEPRSSQDRVLAAMREAIVTCEIAPGSRMVQEDLAARFGVSRIPLREAMRTLEGEGLVLHATHRGAVCRPLEADDVADLYAVRVELERLAARTAAARRADLRSETAALGADAIDAISRGDLAGLIRCDTCFHTALAGASANEHLAATLRLSWSQITRVMHYYFTLERYPQNVWREHAAIARAIATGQPDAAAARLEAHIVHSRDAILRSLREAIA